MAPFQAWGIVEQTVRHSMNEIGTFFDKLESIFHCVDFTKAQIVVAIREFIPYFGHKKKGKNLDQKMQAVVLVCGANDCGCIACVGAKYCAAW